MGPRIYKPVHQGFSQVSKPTCYDINIIITFVSFLQNKVNWIENKMVLIIIKSLCYGLVLDVKAILLSQSLSISFCIAFNSLF